MGGNVSSRIGYYLSVVAPFYPPVIVRSIVIYDSAPVLIPRAAIGRYQLLPGTVPKFDKRGLVKAYVKGMRVVP
jgi:hypothetical protein